MPFRGESSGVIFHAILEREPPSPMRLNPDLPPKLEDVISKSLEKDRDLRYQNASDMRADLQRLKRDTESGRSSARAVIAGRLEDSQVAPSRTTSGSRPASGTEPEPRPKRWLDWGGAGSHRGDCDGAASHPVRRSLAASQSLGLHPAYERRSRQTLARSLR